MGSYGVFYGVLRVPVGSFVGFDGVLWCLMGSLMGSSVFYEIFCGVFYGSYGVQ